MSTDRTLRELMSLDGRVALVTGGAGHIGRAIGHALAELGASVAVVDLSQSGAEAAADELSRRWPVAAAGFACDLEQSEQVRDLPRLVRERFGRIDIIVNCAAFVGTSGLDGWAVPFEQQSDKTWRRALEVNLTAPFILTQAAAADLKASGHGSVINISSIYGLSGPDWRLYEGTSLGNPAAYAASKGGLIQATRWLSTTLAPHVRVNAIAPGGVFRDTPEPFLGRYTARTPLGRMAREEDFKGAMAYLATDLSAYVTGQCLAVDGGWTVW
ncbi:SDR family oxidoreductase [Bradyrhizobium sp. Ash2021]|uniref:SDR family oxidoreductase n=1 Tax=Bradyrhizobium sp. Ash2021 TaxID=2954771 RepID=UPI0028165033|nr:SDR family oxidoreductase [Bradyrhizobium sp. Ash2021]WMT72551.1 SDR family oxidoreductase [Bradyrhizobium sp. Ash2021]